MKSIMKSIMVMVAATIAVAAEAKVEFGTPFSDRMVLQRGMKAPIWGFADAGEAVKVSFAGQSLSTTADAQGKWRVDLAPLTACAEGRVLKAEGKANAVEAKDVLVGEVWFCCGQSNTELPLCGSNPHFRDRKGTMRAMMTRKPQIRFAYASNYRFSVEPRAKAQGKVAWKTFEPENLAKSPSFSAIGVYYALELHDALGVPVGIVGAYWGGTRCEPWTPLSGFQSVPACKDMADWKVMNAVEYKTAGKDPWQRKRPFDQPRSLWNEQVAPWTPMAMKGFIWYQGCSNAQQHDRYADMMQALYNGWAKEFENPNLKLNFVQLAPWGNAVIPYIQEAQAKFARAEKNAHMAIINDIGNLRDIHPYDKETVGQRLAALSLQHDYGFAFDMDSPELKSAKAEGEKVTLEFDHAQALYLYQPDFSVANGFELAGADGKFVAAKLVNLRFEKHGEQINPNRSKGNFDGKGIVLTAEGVAAPKFVRYLYASPWYGAIHNEVDMPLGAFHAEIE